MAWLQKVWHTVAPTLKTVGRSIDNMGAGMEAVKVIETGIPSTVAMPFKDHIPEVGEGTFIAPTASVIGNVTVGPGCSIWYSAKIRGDVNFITIGANTSIGDCVMVHCARVQGDNPTVIGDNVTVGANACIHACTIEDNVVVGMGATVLDGAKVQGPSVLAPGAMVTPRKVVEPGSLWAGSPAVKVRDLTEEEIASIGAAACQTAGLATMHSIECAKDFEQVAKDLDDAEDKAYRSPDYFPKGDPAKADEAPHPFFQNDRKATKFKEGAPLVYRGTPGAEDGAGLAEYGTKIMIK